MGVVGGFNFDHLGFQNSGFDVLIDRLEESYGPVSYVTHCIAPTYPGVEPTVERFRIEELRNSEVRKDIRAISTFYLPPQRSVATDQAIAEQLGLVRPGQTTTWTPDGSINAEYGPIEKRAIAQIKKINFPVTCKQKGTQPVADFLERLARDLKLLSAHRNNPEIVLANPDFDHLTERAGHPQQLCDLA